MYKQGLDEIQIPTISAATNTSTTPNIDRNNLSWSLPDLLSDLGPAEIHHLQYHTQPNPHTTNHINTNANTNLSDPLQKMNTTGTGVGGSQFNIASNPNSKSPSPPNHGSNPNIIEGPSGYIQNLNPYANQVYPTLNTFANQQTAPQIQQQQQHGMMYIQNPTTGGMVYYPGGGNDPNPNSNQNHFVPNNPAPIISQNLVQLAPIYAPNLAQQQQQQTQQTQLQTQNLPSSPAQHKQFFGAAPKQMIPLQIQIPNNNAIPGNMAGYPGTLSPRNYQIDQQNFNPNYPQYPHQQIVQPQIHEIGYNQVYQQQQQQQPQIYQQMPNIHQIHSNSPTNTCIMNTKSNSPNESTASTSSNSSNSSATRLVDLSKTIQNVGQLATCSSCHAEVVIPPNAPCARCYRCSAVIQAGEHSLKPKSVTDFLPSLVKEWKIDFNQIKIEKRIGGGTFGNVLKADWNGTPVAVKTLLVSSLTAEQVNDFIAEISVMSKLRHPNIVLWMGVCTLLPNLAIITEFIEMGSLWDFLRKIQTQPGVRPQAYRVGTYPLVTVDTPITMAKDTARGMNYLHTMTPVIIHRDLKSPNLLVEKSGSLKVCDFGFTVVKGEFNHTQCGTAAYMAPEVMRGVKYDEKVDVYSFGIVLWELVTGYVPYEGMANDAISREVLKKGTRPFIPPHPIVHQSIVDLITACWSEDPKMRPTFTEILVQLDILGQISS